MKTKFRKYKPHGLPSNLIPLIVMSRRFINSLIATSLLAPLAMPLSLLAGNVPPTYELLNGTEFRDLNCPSRSHGQHKRTSLSDDLEPPSAEEIDELGLIISGIKRLNSNRSLDSPSLLGINELSWPSRVAIWGDSHLAAGFFSNELKRISLERGIKAKSTFIPMTMGRAGVNLPIRKYCMDHWKSDITYSSISSMVNTGIGMNFVTGDKDAYLWIDLREKEAEPDVQSIEIFFQGSTNQGVIIVSIDGGEEKAIPLVSNSSFGSVVIVGNVPISVIKIRVGQEPVILNGIYLNFKEKPKAVIDAFGISGATVRSWQKIDPSYFKQFFLGRPYDLVVLEYGTNEGNSLPFDADHYSKILDESLRNMRQVFPEAGCLLVGPGDRGVLLSKSRRVNTKHKDHSVKLVARNASRRPNKISTKAEIRKASHKVVDLLKFALVHEKIYQLQKQIGERFGCLTWSMQYAMGGVGSSYSWVFANPPLMSRDLTHFTALGYKQLARQLTEDLNWWDASKMVKPVIEKNSP
jgi:hypothetical protein